MFEKKYGRLSLTLQVRKRKTPLTSVQNPSVPVTLNPMDQLTKSRILWLNGEVNDENMADLSAKMLLLSAQDRESDIFLYINSPGGSVTAGVMLYDVIKLIPNDVATVAVGMAASMGQFLLSNAGTKGKRFITPNARVLLHQPLGGMGGTESDVRRQAELILDMKKRLATITAEATGKTVEQINLDGDRDRWFTADEALEYGFVDHIITHAHNVTEISASDAKAGA